MNYRNRETREQIENRRNQQISQRDLAQTDTSRESDKKEKEKK